MGRHRWTNRLTVEECPLYLPVAAFHRHKVFALPPNMYSTSTLSWTPPDGGWQARMDYRVEHSGPTGLTIVIYSQNLGIRVGTGRDAVSVTVDWQTIPVTTVRPPLGGKRFWFVCGCERRVGWLYLPLGRHVFCCRHCYNLTYRSAQRHNHRVNLLARNPFAIAAATHAKGLTRRLVGIKALAKFQNWHRDGPSGGSI